MRLGLGSLSLGGLVRQAQIARHHRGGAGSRAAERHEGRGGGERRRLALFLDDARVLQRRCDVLHQRHLVNRLGEAHALLGAADAGMAAAHRPVAVAGVAESDRRTVGVGFRALQPSLYRQ